MSSSEDLASQLDYVDRKIKYESDIQGLQKFIDPLIDTSQHSLVMPCKAAVTASARAWIWLINSTTRAPERGIK